MYSQYIFCYVKASINEAGIQTYMPSCQNYWGLQWGKKIILMMNTPILSLWIHLTKLVKFVFPCLILFIDIFLLINLFSPLLPQNYFLSFKTNFWSKGRYFLPDIYFPMTGNLFPQFYSLWTLWNKELILTHIMSPFQLLNALDFSFISQNLISLKNNQK